MKNQVIITADDYGICNTIDNAIIKSLKAGHLTSVSAVITHPSSAQRIKKLVELQHKLRGKNDFGIGLHFCITSGQPLYKVRGGLPSSLADPENSDFFREAAFYKFKDIQGHHLREELTLQFQKLADIIGKENIDHLTNHHGIIYFDENMFNEYIQTAATWGVAVRSPMSWYRKFKKVGSIPDFDSKILGNPTMRRGMKLGMWRKLGQMSYSNFLKRMNTASELRVNYPDVLCEFIYGQCAEEINKGKEVLEHCLEKYTDPNGRTNLKNSNDLTIKKSGTAKLSQVTSRYEAKQRSEHFSMELIFHLADKSELSDELLDILDDENPHGVNTEYFNTRMREFACMSAFNWNQYRDSFDVNYIPFKQLL